MFGALDYAWLAPPVVRVLWIGPTTGAGSIKGIAELGSDEHPDDRICRVSSKSHPTKDSRQHELAEGDYIGQIIHMFPSLYKNRKPILPLYHTCSKMSTYLMKKYGGGSGFERATRVIEVKSGDVGGKLARPERDGREVGHTDISSGDLTASGDDNLFLMKGEESDGVGEGEFM